MASWAELQSSKSFDKIVEAADYYLKYGPRFAGDGRGPGTSNKWVLQEEWREDWSDLLRIDSVAQFVAADILMDKDPHNSSLGTYFASKFAFRKPWTPAYRKLVGNNTAYWVYKTLQGQELFGPGDISAGLHVQVLGKAAQIAATAVVTYFTIYSGPALAVATYAATGAILQTVDDRLSEGHRVLVVPSPEQWSQRAAARAAAEQAILDKVAADVQAAEAGHAVAQDNKAAAAAIAVKVEQQVKQEVQQALALTQQLVQQQAALDAIKAAKLAEAQDPQAKLRRISRGALVAGVGLVALVLIVSFVKTKR